MMRIDAHQHFWRYSQAEYPWIGPQMSELMRDRLPQDLLPLLEETNLDGSVAIQARQTLEETQWLLDLSGEHGRIKGVVGWVDLCGSGLRAQLERLSAYPKLRGVRHVVQDEPDDDFMLRDDFLRGIAALAAFDLTYDILVFPRHLPVALELVARFPGQSFVLDHIGKPFIKDRLLEPWTSDLQRLAARPNVYCKVSGMITEADWSGWKRNDFQPFLDVVFDAFGPERIMFGSDWPVCTVAGTYSQVAGIVSDYANQLSQDERAAVWGGTALRFYGL